MRRRTILKLWGAVLLAGRALAGPVAAAAAPGPAPGQTSGPTSDLASGPGRAGLYRVNGWLLTEADLRRLPGVARGAVPVRQARQ